MGRHRAAALSLVLCLFLPNVAWSKSDDWITMGLGANLGLGQHRVGAGMLPPTFSGGISLQLRLLRLMGLEISYAPWDQITDGEATILDSRLKLSLAINSGTDPVEVVMKGGIGGPDPLGIFYVGRPENSYHLGGGFNIRLGDNFMMSLEGLFMVRGHEAWLPTGEDAEHPMTSVRTLANLLRDSRYQFTVGFWYYI